MKNPPGSLYSTRLEIMRRGVPPLTLSKLVKEAWHVLEPTTPLIWNWHLDVLCDHVQAQLELGKFGKPWAQNLLINVPPGTMKSLIVSVFAPAWVWLWKPSWRAIFFSGNPRVTIRDSVKCRELVESKWYRETFAPTWSLAEDQNAKGNYKTTASGFRLAITAGAKATGDRGDAIFVDDPLDADEAPSKTAREAVNYWWSQTAANRINDPAFGTRTGIMQRLHEEDWSAHVLAEGNWRHLRIPMEFDATPVCVCSDCTLGRSFLGWRDPRTVDGQLLFPQRFSQEILVQEKTRLGSAGYAGQMQQRPTPAEGNMFQRSWWRFWSADGKQHPRPRGATSIPPRTLDTKGRFDEIIQTWDCSFKDLDTSDFVCGFTIGRIGADKFVLDCDWARYDFTNTVQRVEAMARAWPRSLRILIEDKANGTAVINTLKSRIAGVIPVEPEGGKESRAAAITAQAESGNIYLPEGAEWLERFFDELGSFPRGKHDDATDSLAQGIRALSEGSTMANTRILLGLK